MNFLTRGGIGFLILFNLMLSWTIKLLDLPTNYWSSARIQIEINFKKGKKVFRPLQEVFAKKFVAGSFILFI